MYVREVACVREEMRSHEEHGARSGDREAGSDHARPRARIGGRGLQSTALIIKNPTRCNRHRSRSELARDGSADAVDCSENAARGSIACLRGARGELVPIKPSPIHRKWRARRCRFFCDGACMRRRDARRHCSQGEDRAAARPVQRRALGAALAVCGRICAS